MDASRLAQRCAADGEFRLAARYWNGRLRLDLPGGSLGLVFENGASAAGPWADGPGSLALRAPADVWDKLLMPIPPPMFNDIVPAAAFGFVVEGEPETYWQYYPAIRRLIDLVREEWNRDATL